mmetsp:Transcript_3966/g.18211  ORF Transcript_3966/g.18211 Transcript_3966/m.18211 type:complete len:404 (+) Transcript_3966:91-1302(+)
MTHAIVQRATVASAPRAGTASATRSRTVPTAVRVPNRKVDRPAHRQPCITVLHAASSADAVADLRPLPQTCAEQVTQAASVIRAASTSHRRQRIQLLLPINQRKNEFTSVESDDYGMNDADVYKAAMETASAMIRAVDPDGGEMSATRVDDDNDPVGVLQNAKGSVRALVIPNAQNLQNLRDLAALGDANGTQITLLVNPQWNEAGQVVSDFGVGPWRRKAMDFLQTFESTYSLTEYRVGAAATRDPVRGGDYMGVGGVARVLKTHDSAWQTFAMGADGSSECVRADATEPTYEYLEKDVFTKFEYSLAGRRSGDTMDSLETRLESAATEAMSGTIDWSIASTAEINAAVRADAITSDDVAALSKAGLRTALGAMGLPTSGKLEAMRERLADALLGDDKDQWD